MVSGYCYRVCFEDGGDETTNYVGAVLQVGDTINLDGEHWIVTEAKVVSERRGLRDPPPPRRAGIGSLTPLGSQPAIVLVRLGRVCAAGLPLPSR
jgi:hypothetical protein